MLCAPLTVLVLRTGEGKRNGLEYVLSLIGLWKLQIQ